MDPRQAFAELLSSDEQAAVGRQNVRLREYVPSVRRPGATFEDREGLTLQALGLAPAKVLLLETRAAGEVR